jgi:hypothetical protein
VDKEKLEKKIQAAEKYKIAVEPYRDEEEDEDVDENLERLTLGCLVVLGVMLAVVTLLR